MSQRNGNDNSKRRSKKKGGSRARSLAEAGIPDYGSTRERVALRMRFGPSLRDYSPNSPSKNDGNLRSYGRNIIKNSQQSIRSFFSTSNSNDNNNNDNNNNSIFGTSTFSGFSDSIRDRISPIANRISPIALRRKLKTKNKTNDKAHSIIDSLGCRYT